MSIKKSAIKLCLIFVMFFIFPLISNAAVMYVHCGNTKKVGGDGPWPGDFSIVTLTRRNSGQVALYPYVDDVWIISGDHGYFGYTEDKFLDVEDEVRLSWDAPDGASGKCPATCRYEVTWAVRRELHCNGYSEPTDIVEENNFIYVFVPSSSSARWFNEVDGSIFHEVDGGFKTIAVDKQQNAAETYIKNRQKNRDPRLWIYSVNFNGFVGISALDMEKEFDNWFLKNNNKQNLIEETKSSFISDNQKLNEQCSSINTKGVVSGVDYEPFISSVNNEVFNISKLYNLDKSSDINFEFDLFFKNFLLNDNVGEANFSDGFLAMMSRHFETYAKTKGYSVANISPRDVADLKEMVLQYADNYKNCLEKIYNAAKDGKINLDDTSVTNLNRDLDSLSSLNFIPQDIEDCETLLGTALLEKIQEYMNIIKIIVPILVVVFSILEFGKVILSSDADEMKKAQAKFIKRLIIAVIIFFVPLLVNFILNMVNSVWGAINGGSCGIK